MRLRNIPGAREEMFVNPYVINEPQQYRGHFRELFSNDHPLHIEVGMGKGQFIMELAKQNPDINYIGIEKYSSVLLRALQKRPELETNNLLFLRVDAELLPEVFGEDEVDKIYLNFSDPWPKDRHAKRRLTSKEFLARYQKFLKAGNFLEFKTDNRKLFDFSLEEVTLAGWKLDACTYDLHNDKVLCAGNIMTEYEERFSSMGQPIHKMIIHYEKEDK